LQIGDRTLVGTGGLEEEKKDEEERESLIPDRGGGGGSGGALFAIICHQKHEKEEEENGLTRHAHTLSGDASADLGREGGRKRRKKRRSFICGGGGGRKVYLQSKLLKRTVLVARAPLPGSPSPWRYLVSRGRGGERFNQRS